MTGYVHILGLVTQLVNHKEFAQGSTTGLPSNGASSCVHLYHSCIFFRSSVWREDNCKGRTGF